METCLRLADCCDSLLEIKNNHRLEFALLYHRTNKGQRLSFKNRSYLYPIYQDQSQEIIIKKAVQMGITEWLLCDSFANADQGMTVFYVFPTQVIRGRVVRDRIDNMSMYCPFYFSKLRELKVSGKQKAKGEASVSMKRFGNGLLVFVGSNAKSEFVAVPADVAVIDEKNDCDQDNIELTWDRLDASSHKLRRVVGVPTFDNVGIDIDYAGSDRKQWHIVCEHCGKWQVLDFFKNIISQTGDNEFELMDKSWNEDSEKDIKVLCKFCGGGLDRLAKGEWVAQSPSRNVSGYEITQLFSPTKTIAEIYDTFTKSLFNEGKKQIFYNSKLGQPYTATGMKVTRALISGCMGDYGIPGDKIPVGNIAGVDVGKLLHVWIFNVKKKRFLFIGTVRDFDELGLVMKNYFIKLMVIDALPEIHKVSDFQKSFPAKVWLCRYHKQEKIEDMKIETKERIVSVDRTQSMDCVIEEMVEKEIPFPKNLANLDNGDVVDQLIAPVRRYDERGQRYIWDEGSRADHYFHGLNYLVIAKKILDKSCQVAFL